MEIIARFAHDKLDHAINTKTHLVVSVTAPTLDWVTKRPAICLIALIDLSGSMKGAKLDYAKKSLHKLVDQLQPGDFTGLIGFESRAHILVQPQPVTPALKDEMRKAINALRDQGGTNLWMGIEEAVKRVQALDLPPKFLKRVIMFTDGQPTEGVTDTAKILRMTGSTRGSVTISSFGYGGGAYGCDQNFLTQLANEGQGNYAYVQDPDDALTAFGRELGGLLSTYAQDIHITLEPSNGHHITKVVTDIKTETDALGELDFQFPDILSEETRNFIFEVELVKQDKVGPRAVNLFSVNASYSTLTEDGKRETKSIETKAKAQFVDEDEAQKAPHKELDEVIALAQVVRAQLEAEEQAKKGEFQAATRIMEGISKDVTGRGHVNTGRIATNVGGRVGSASLYAASGGYLRSMSYGGTRSMGLSGMDDEAGADLMSANVSMSNSSMAFYTESFQEEAQPSVLFQPPMPVVSPPVGIPAPWNVALGSPDDPAAHMILNPQGVSMGSIISTDSSHAALGWMANPDRHDPVMPLLPVEDDAGLTAVTTDKSE